MEKFFCIFGGGGIRGCAYTGAIKALEELKIGITGYAGSSIGAVVAGLLSLGYDYTSIKEVFDNIDFSFFKDINFNFGKDFALSKGNNFYEWIKKKIETKFYENAPDDTEKQPVKFKDLSQNLIIYSVDLTTSRLYEFSKEKTPDAEVAHAIRVSVAMPGLYSPVFGESECLVDGDLIKSMPLWMASDTVCSANDKILEFRLESNEKRRNVSNTAEYLNAVYDTMTGVATDFIIKTYRNHDKCNYIKIDLDGISVVDFMISSEKKAQMIKMGYEATMSYFKVFYPKKKRKLHDFYKDLLSSFLKIKLFTVQKDIENAKYETANVFSKLIIEKEIADKTIVSKILAFKKLFDENCILRNGFLNKKLSILDSKMIIESVEEIISHLNQKISS